VTHREGRPQASFLSLTSNPFCPYNGAVGPEHVAEPDGRTDGRRRTVQPLLLLLNAVAIADRDYNISTDKNSPCRNSFLARSANFLPIITVRDLFDAFLFHSLHVISFLLQFLLMFLFCLNTEQIIGS